MSLLRRTTAAAVLVLTTSFGLVACSDDGGAGSNPAADTDGDDEVTPDEVLAFAQGKLEETSGVEATLSTDDTVDSDAFLSEAAGTIIADPPAFEGTASGTFQGVPASDVDIVSVDGEVYAKIFGGFQTFDLPECVPDPAGLLDDKTGFATVLTAAEQVEAGDAVRGGADNDEILTPYTAVVPGDAVRNVLPCAPGDQFVATFSIDDQGLLRRADLKGEFFEGAGELTYSIAVSAYDVTKTIAKP